MRPSRRLILLTALALFASAMWWLFGPTFIPYLPGLTVLASLAGLVIDDLGWWRDVSAIDASQVQRELDRARFISRR